MTTRHGEAYDDLADPWQLESIASTLDPTLRFRFHEMAESLQVCQGPGCRAEESEGLPAPPTPADAVGSPRSSSP